MKLKLCQITHAYGETKGGVELYLQDLNKALLSQAPNLEIHVLYPTSRSNARIKSSFSQKVGQHQIYLHFLDKDSWHSPNALSRIQYVWQELSTMDIEYDFDLYHHHAPFDIPLVLGMGALLLRRKPIMFTYHGAVDPFKLLNSSRRLTGYFGYIAKRRLAKEIFRRSHCTGVCGASRVIYQDLAFETLGSAVDCDFFSPFGMNRTALRKRFGLAERFVVIYPARLTEPKAQLDAIKVIENLKHRFPQILLQLIGSCDTAADEYYLLGVRDYIHSHDLHTWVRLMEPVDQVHLREWYRVADALLFTSFFEGLPLVILEAASMELPIVTTNVGGIPEIIKNGENGFLVTSKDIDAFAVALAMLVGNAQLCQQIGKSARETVERHFSPERLAQKCLDYYSRILDKARNFELRNPNSELHPFTPQ